MCGLLKKKNERKREKKRRKKGRIKKKNLSVSLKSHHIQDMNIVQDMNSEHLASRGIRLFEVVIQELRCLEE